MASFQNQNNGSSNQELQSCDFEYIKDLLGLGETDLEYVSFLLNTYFKGKDKWNFLKRLNKEYDYKYRNKNFDQTDCTLAVLVNMNQQFEPNNLSNSITSRCYKVLRERTDGER